jgi:hypothetical protein
MKALYRWLDACEANGIDVLWANYYTSDSSLYASDPESAWMSRCVQDTLSETGRYPVEWPRKDEPADREHFIESFVEVLRYLVQEEGYQCVKQVSLFNEATSDHSFLDHNPWPFYRDLHAALKKRGLREHIQIIGPDDHNVPRWFWREFFDFPVDVVAFHDYWNFFDANRTSTATDVWDYHTCTRITRGTLGDYAQVASAAKALAQRQGIPVHLAITEYGHTGNTWQLLSTKDPAVVFRGILSMKCFLCEILKLGYGGALRWSHWPGSWGHSYGPVAVQGVHYDPDNPEREGPLIAEALKMDAPLVPVPFVYEPERLANTVVRRGDSVVGAKIEDVPPGVHWVALKDASGSPKLLIVNLRGTPVSLNWLGAPASCSHLTYAGDERATMAENQVSAEGEAVNVSLPPLSLNGLLPLKVGS